MADNVKFEDFSVEVKIALNDTSVAWLYEAGNEVASHAKRNCKMDDTGRKLAGSYQCNVDEEAGVATIGTPMEAGYWEEFGTGAFAVKGDGRKGWWVYVKDGTYHATNGGRSYSSAAQAQAVAASMRAEGLDAYATNGRLPMHTLQNAFEQTRETNIELLEARLKENME